MNERTSYQDIRSWLLDSCYQYCRGKLMAQKNWVSGEYEIGYAYEQYCDGFTSVIERLMLEVLAIILLGGRVPQAEQYHRQKIANLLIDDNLESLLFNLPMDESEEFIQDMKILKLI